MSWLEKNVLDYYCSAIVFQLYEELTQVYENPGYLHADVYYEMGIKERESARIEQGWKKLWSLPEGLNVGKKLSPDQMVTT